VIPQKTSAPILSVPSVPYGAAWTSYWSPGSHHADDR
jgi:hypothetical protein